MKNIPSPQDHHQAKRKRGGQKGNQNARKHGFYSRALNPSKLCEFWNITNLEGVDPPVAMLRVKLQSLLHQNPANHRVLMEADRLLVKYYQAKFGLDKTDTQCLKMVVRNWFENYLARSQPSSSVGNSNAISQNESNVL